MKDIAKERKYDNVFYATLGQIERNAEKGKDTPDSYSYLTTGRVTREPQLRIGRSLDPSAAFSTHLPRCQQETAESLGVAALQRSVKKLGSALAPKVRTQDVRSDAEKAQDREYESSAAPVPAFFTNSVRAKDSDHKGAHQHVWGSRCHPLFTTGNGTSIDTP